MTQLNWQVTFQQADPVSGSPLHIISYGDTNTFPVVPHRGDTIKLNSTIYSVMKCMVDYDMDEVTVYVTNAQHNEEYNALPNPMVT